MTERELVKLVARVAPWLAPMPSAYLVARASARFLAFPLPVAILTAVVIETLGLVSVFNWQWFTDWNNRKLQSDPPAPATLPAVLGGFYLVVTIGLVVLLEVWPAGATYAPAVIPLLALVGTVNLALFVGQENREAAAAAEKAQRKAERQERKAAKVATATRRKAETAKRKDSARLPETETRQRAAAILAAMPEISGAELGRQLGKSDRMGRLLRSELVASNNGHNGNGRG